MEGFLFLWSCTGQAECVISSRLGYLHCIPEELGNPPVLVFLWAIFTRVLYLHVLCEHTLEALHWEIIHLIFDTNSIKSFPLYPQFSAYHEKKLMPPGYGLFELAVSLASDPP